MIGGYPRLALPHLAAAPTPGAAVITTAPGVVYAPVFFVLESQTYTPAGVTQVFALGRLSHPHLAFAMLPQAVESTGMVLASDAGYVGNGGVYPPRMDTAFEMDLEISLDPHSSAGGYQFGTVKLINTDRFYDNTANNQNNQGRPVRVLAGRKVLDKTRGILVDPPYSSLVPMFGGIGGVWSTDDTYFTMPVRDATYWIQGNIQSSFYGGGGLYDGNATLAGLSKPKTRGGTNSLPVQNVTPIQIDPVKWIYQYTDAPGTVVNLYEGGYLGGITFAGDVADLYSGSTPAGQYRTCNARGCFQLGSKPQQAITCDVTGSFPIAGTISTVIGLARFLLTEDMGLPVTLMDIATFIGADATYPYTAGVFISDEATDGRTVVNNLLASIGAQLVPTAAGQVRPFVLRVPGTNIQPYFSLSARNVIGAPTPVDLPDGLNPPTWRWRVAYGHNYTVQTSGLLPLATAAHTQIIAKEDQYSSWADTTVRARYLVATDPDPLPGALLNVFDAATVAAALGALWGVKRRTYDVVVPLIYGVGVEIGNQVTLTWNTTELSAGKLGQVVGVSFRSYDATVTLRILV